VTNFKSGYLLHFNYLLLVQANIIAITIIINTITITIVTIVTIVIPSRPALFVPGRRLHAA
jgi:hypothetical protein